MKSVGIIVEYNPIHNGHIYHIRKALELSDSDCLICITSGNFVQRGEPSVIDKFKKAEIALDNGVDLVLELPYICVNQSAQLFAYGAVKILDMIGVDQIVFGSENDIKHLYDLSNKIENINLEGHLDNGVSYPKALANALGSDILTPNNILGIEYINAIKKLNSKIEPISINRTTTNHSDTELNDSNVQSASTLRRILREDQDITKYVPGYDIPNPVFIEDFSSVILYKLNSADASELSNLHLVSEGIENKLKKEARKCKDIVELINNSVSKRYTKSRISRILMSIMLNTTSISIDDIDNIDYIRVLGFNNKGQRYLKTINSEVNVVTKVKEGISKYLDIDIKNSFIYYMKSNEKNKEFDKPIIKE